MVVLDIKVDGEKKNLYVDGRLHYNLIEKVKPKIKKKDFDWVCIVDGGEGAGKSVFSMQLAKILDPTFNLDRVCMSPQEFTKAVMRAKKGQAIIFDEAFPGLSSRASLTEKNRLLVGLMMEMRQKNLFIIIVMPTIFLLDRYVALFRARGLFHIYLKNGKRGQWMFFNNKKKKLLYLIGKKMFNYGVPKTNFRGRFQDQYTVNEEKYREKKGDALKNKSRVTRSAAYKYQRDLLLWLFNKKLGKNNTQISKLCKEWGFKIERNTISEIITDKDRELLQEEIDKEQE